MADCDVAAPSTWAMGFSGILRDADEEAPDEEVADEELPVRVEEDPDVCDPELEIPDEKEPLETDD